MKYILIYFITISHLLPIQLLSGLSVVNKKISAYALAVILILLVSSLTYALIITPTKYNLFVLIYAWNTYLITKIKCKRIQSKQNIFIYIAIFIIACALFDLQPNFVYSPVFSELSGFSANNYYRDLGIFGNPNITAFFISASCFAYLSTVKKSNRWHNFIIFVIIALSYQQFLSRTMIISSILTLIICANLKTKLMIISMVSSSLIIFYSVIDQDSALWTRTFLDFDSLTERLKLFYLVVQAVDLGYFDSDLTAGTMFLGKSFVLFHLINYIFLSNEHNKYIVTYIFISGIAGVGMMSGYTTCFLVLVNIYGRRNVAA